jgi:DNA ligase D-like protein (predicted 3'-phosphoesterase)
MTPRDAGAVACRAAWGLSWKAGHNVEGRRVPRIRDKRDPCRGPEPPGYQNARCGGRRFVVQKHAARRLHYDFRLEADGVLKSWAVPRGPSANPRDERLAIRTEDHPISSTRTSKARFPRVSVGTVIVWDAGTYDNLTKDNAGAEIPVAEATERGHLAVFLHGHKLIGGYALTPDLPGRRPGTLAARERGRRIR